MYPIGGDISATDGNSFFFFFFFAQHMSRVTTEVSL